MRRRENCVFDVGLYDGDDTAYYLHKGYSVVAIDTNPAMVDKAKRRFHAELENGTLSLLNAGITRQAGEQDFFISETFSEWSSFDEANATKDGSSATKIRVQCIPFSDILKKYDIPYYLKIDIEGNDRLCIEALEPGSLPNYVSIEMSHKRGDEDIRTLGSVGYTKFKCIRQNDLRPITPWNIARKLAFRRVASRPDIVGKVLRTLRIAKSRVFPPREGDWQFSQGSSGTFGPDLPGPWISAEEAVSVWKALHDIDQDLSAGGVGEWFDFHATTG